MTAATAAAGPAAAAGSLRIVYTNSHGRPVCYQVPGVHKTAYSSTLAVPVVRKGPFLCRTRHLLTHVLYQLLVVLCTSIFTSRPLLACWGCTAPCCARSRTECSACLARSARAQRKRWRPARPPRPERRRRNYRRRPRRCPSPAKQSKELLEGAIVAPLYLLVLCDSGQADEWTAVATFHARTLAPLSLPAPV